MNAQIPHVTLIALAITTLLFFQPSAADWLQYDRPAILTGQLWRLLTCHFTHWSPTHALWSILAFAVLALICEGRCRCQAIVSIVAASLLISLSFLTIFPGVRQYRGLSGIDSSLFGLLIILLVHESLGQPFRIFVPLGAMLGFTAKVMWEFYTSRAVFAHGSFVPSPWAHVIGLCVGIASGALFQTRIHHKRVRKNEIEIATTQPRRRRFLEAA